MTPLAEGEQLLKFIPQRSPMVMIDKLYFSDAEKCVTGLNISEENIFCRDGFFREPGLIENMAQTAAVHAGYNTHPTLPKGGLSDDGEVSRCPESFLGEFPPAQPVLRYGGAEHGGIL